MTVRLIDPLWDEYKVYENSMTEIGMKPLKYQTWEKRYKETQEKFRKENPHFYGEEKS